MSTAASHNKKSPLMDCTASSLTGTSSASIQHERAGASGLQTTEYWPTERNENSNAQQCTKVLDPCQERQSVLTTAPRPPTIEECLPAHTETGTDDTGTATPTQKPAGSHARCNYSKIPPTRKDCRKLFVGGLPSDITEQEFRTFFEQFGSVMDSVVMLDRETQRSRGFGFVTFDEVNVARNVLGIGEDEPVVGCSSSMEMRGKLIEIKAAQPKEFSSNSSHVGCQHHQRFHQNKRKKQDQHSHNRGVNKHSHEHEYDAPALPQAPAPASLLEPMAMYGATPFTAEAAAVYYHGCAAAVQAYFHPTAWWTHAAGGGFVTGYMAPISYYSPTAYLAMQPLTENGGVPPPPGSATLMAKPFEGFAATATAGALPQAHIMQQQAPAPGCSLAASAAGSVLPVKGPAQVSAFPPVAIPYPAPAAAAPPASTQKTAAAVVVNKYGSGAVEVEKNEEEKANPQ